MRYYDHTGNVLFRAVAAAVDLDLRQRRDAHTECVTAVKAEMARERQRVLDAEIVAKREARIAHERVQRLVSAR